MIDKIKNILIVILICFVIFSIGFSLFKLIASSFDQKDLITSEEVCLYTVSDNLVTTYNTHYYIKACFENLIESCKLGEYNKLYEIYIKDYKQQYTKAEVIEILKNLIDVNRQNSYQLKGIYNINGIHLLQVEINGQEKSLLFAKSDSKTHDYEFAFVK